MKNLLVAYDGSPGAHRAFLFGLELAQKFGIPLTILSVIRLFEPPEEVETRDALEEGKSHSEELFKALKAEADEWRVEIHTKVAVGHPAEQIVRWAELHQVDQIVMGHQTRSTFGRWILGSTPDKVVQHAPCTVTIVK